MGVVSELEGHEVIARSARRRTPGLNRTVTRFARHCRLGPQRLDVTATDSGHQYPKAWNRLLNPHRIYRDEWAQALVAQAETVSYSTFVAMPFHEHYSYKASHILSTVVEAAVVQANATKKAPRPFATPERVDVPKGASVITDDIALGILNSHFFLADLTFQNPGVLLETGVALAVKPSRQIILITQGRHSDLHFDLQHNNVICYSPDGAIDAIAGAFVAAAFHFENQLDHYARSVRLHLSPDAIHLLLTYADYQRHRPGFSLHADNAHAYFSAADSRVRFEFAARELRDRDLLWTDIAAIPHGFRHGMHTTELGKLVTAHIERELCDEPNDGLSTEGIAADGDGESGSIQT